MPLDPPAAASHPLALPARGESEGAALQVCEHEGQTPRDRGSTSALLELAWPIDLALTVASHGWVYLEPWRWESETGTLSHPERIGGAAGTIHMTQRNPATLAIVWEGFAGIA